MKRNDNTQYDDDLEMIDLMADHIEAADAGEKEAKKKAKKRSKEKGSAAVPITVLFILLLTALGCCGYLMVQLEGRKKELSDEKAARAEESVHYEEELKASEAVISGMNAAIEDLENKVAVADQAQSGVTGSIAPSQEQTQETAEEPDETSLETGTAQQGVSQLQNSGNGVISARDDIRDIMMAAALKEGGGPMTAVRAVFDDMAFYTVDKDTYEFAPLLDNVPRNDIREDQIVKDEDGTMHYMVDCVDKGIPMIDVSEYQGVIDWNKVAASGIQYAMIRAGYRGYGSGKLVEDKYVDDNIRGATAAGIKIGVYFFSQAVTEAEAREEAQVCIKHLAGYKADLPIVLDVEHINYDDARADALDQKTRTDVALAFIDEVRQAGYKPMLYTGLLVYFHYLDQSRICDLPLWYAFYSEYLYFPYKFKCWQYTDSATVPGIGGKCDMSIWVTDPLSL